MKITFEYDDPKEARAHFDMITGDVKSAPVTEAPAASPAPAATTETKEAEAPATVDGVDVHGMPHDPSIHQKDGAKKADGSWKAAKGKADEAKAALDAFRAAGGNVTPPETSTAPATGGMPSGMPAAGGMPSAQKAADMPAPVSQAKVEEKIIGMFQRGTLDNDKYVELLTKHGINLEDPSSSLQTNESLRAALFGDCCAIEPEAA